METDKYIEVADGHFIAAKKTREVQIKIRDENGKPFIVTLYNMILAPDSCNRLFSIVTLMNLGHTWLLYKGVLHGLFWWKQTEHGDITVYCTKKTCNRGKNEGKVKIKKQIPKNKFSLELLHQILGHRFKRSLLHGYIKNV